jgi:hypothetical protein
VTEKKSGEMFRKRGILMPCRLCNDVMSYDLDTIIDNYLHTNSVAAFPGP